MTDHAASQTAKNTRTRGYNTLYSLMVGRGLAAVKHAAYGFRQQSYRRDEH